MSFNFNDNNERPLDTIINDGGYTSIFRTIGVVGDSLSSGEFEAVSKNGEHTYHDFFEYSWGQFLGRSCGSTVYNFSRGGMTAREYCETFADGMGYWNPKYACQAYIIALGVNDLFNFGHEFGSLDNIDLNNYLNNEKSFVGYYATIIQRLKAIQPRAVFFLMTLPNDTGWDNGMIKKHREFLYKLSEMFDNTYVLDLYEYAPVYDDEFKKLFFMNGHLNAMGYKYTASLVGSYIDYIIRHNAENFAEVGFIGTDLHGV